MREKHKFQKQLDVFFCYSLYICYFISLNRNGSRVSSALDSNPESLYEIFSSDHSAKFKKESIEIIVNREPER